MKKNDVYKHISVLLNEVITNLDIKSDGIYMDETLGGGGHTEAILKANATCNVYATDLDPEALRITGNRLSEYGVRYHGFHCNFKQSIKMLDDMGI